jgi:hypothetical protein
VFLWSKKYKVLLPPRGSKKLPSLRRLRSSLSDADLTGAAFLGPTSPGREPQALKPAACWTIGPRSIRSTDHSRLDTSRSGSAESSISTNLSAAAHASDSCPSTVANPTCCQRCIAAGPRPASTHFDHRGSCPPPASAVESRA